MIIMIIMYIAAQLLNLLSTIQSRPSFLVFNKTYKLMLRTEALCCIKILRAVKFAVY